MTEDDFRIARTQAPAAKAKQALMIAANELGVFTFYFPFQLSDPAQRKSLRAMLASQFGTAVALPEMHTVTIPGNPQDGTFTLTFDWHPGSHRGRLRHTETTAPIDVNASEQDVQDVLAGLIKLRGDVTVTSGPGRSFLLTFHHHEDIEITAAGPFNSGTTPKVTVSRPAGVFHLVVLDNIPILVPEDDALGFTIGVVLARLGVEAARRVSYRPEMLPVAKR
jgi:hypothetical protein